MRSTISSIVRGELPKLEACEEESIKEKNDGELFWKFGGLVFKEWLGVEEMFLEGEFGSKDENQ